MAQQSNSISSDGATLEKSVGIMFIAGAVLGGAGILVHPQVQDITNMVEHIQSIADTIGGQWQMAQLLLIFGFWMLLTGFAGVQRSLSNSSSAAWARLGLNGVTIGTVVWIVHKGIELGMTSLVAQWVNTSGAEKTTLLLIATSIRQVDSGLAPTFNMMMWLGLALMGIALVRSTIYPRWLGWILIALGVADTVLGFLSYSNLTFAIPAVLVILLTMIWAFAAGLWIVRQAQNNAGQARPIPVSTPRPDRTA